MGHQQVGLVGVGPELVQQVVDALGQLHHALAAGVAVGKVGLGDAELLAVPGRALVAAKALLPEPGLTPGRNAGGLCNGPGGVGGAGQGRVQDLIDAEAAGPELFAQLPGLGAAFFGQGAVGHAADLVFHVPHGLAVAGEIDLVRRLGQPVIPQGDGAALVDVQPGQLGIRVGENPLRAVGSLQQDITEHGLALGQLLAAIKLLLNAQNAVVFFFHPLRPLSGRLFLTL